MIIDDQSFFKQRKELFANGPVEEFDLGETVSMIQDTARRGLSVAGTMRQADRLLVQPRSGLSDHVQMLRLLKDLGHADIGSITIDSHTRLCQWDQARDGKNLNGYPLVTQGRARGRDLVQATDIPLEVRHGSPDGRLLAETSYGVGITSFEGGGLSYTLPYSKDQPLRETTKHWQYIDRLTGWLTNTSGVMLDRELFGTLTAV